MVLGGGVRIASTMISGLLPSSSSSSSPFYCMNLEHMHVSDARGGCSSRFQWRRGLRAHQKGAARRASFVALSPASAARRADKEEKETKSLPSPLAFCSQAAAGARGRIARNARG